MSNQNKVPSVECAFEKLNESTKQMSSSENYISRLLKNDVYGNYGTTLFKRTVSHRVSVKPLTNKLLVIYDEELLKKLCDARKIILHKIASFSSQRRDTYFIVILFEKYEKFLTGVWLITNKIDPNSYQTFLKYIRIHFPGFKPEEAVVDYDKDMQLGLRSTFSEIKFIPSFLHQMQEIIEKGIQTNTVLKTNRIMNTEKHCIIKKFMALSLLPKEHVYACYFNLVKECRADHGSYFDIFISYYNEEWIEKWKPEVFCVYRMKDLTKIFFELYACRKMFASNTEIEPIIFLDKIKSTLSEVRQHLISLEHGNILPYCLPHEDKNVEHKLHKTWNRLSNNSITIKECLTICSNLLNNNFIDELIDSATHEITNNKRELKRYSQSMHDIEKLM